MRLRGTCLPAWELNIPPHMTAVVCRLKKNVAPPRHMHLRNMPVSHFDRRSLLPTFLISFDWAWGADISVTVEYAHVAPEFFGSVRPISGFIVDHPATRTSQCGVTYNVGDPIPATPQWSATGTDSEEGPGCAASKSGIMFYAKGYPLACVHASHRTLPSPPRLPLRRLLLPHRSSLPV